MQPIPENAGRVLAALDEFGFGSLGLTAEDFSHPDRVVQLGYPPVRVDLITSLTGTTWDDVAASRAAGTYGDLSVYYIGRDQLVVNKRATGRQKDLRMSTSDVIEPQFVEAKDCQYLYQDANGHVFMDNESYEQFHLSQDVIQDTMRYMVEGDTVQVVYVENEPLNVQLPTAVVLEVTEAEEAVKGDTVSNLQKSATVATGYTLKVPGHVKAGDKIKVNTDTGEFLGRA